MISSESIEEIKRISLVDVISETVELKRSGSNFTGLCPFHNEKSPSFHIKSDNNYYHCFGCGASGNVISFVMETQNLSFPEAVEYLASRFNITLKYTKKKANKDGFSTNYFYRVNALAYEFYSDFLRKNFDRVKDYLVERKLTKDSLINFGIGLSPESWSDLYQFLKGRGVPEELIFRSGLVKKSSSGKVYDTFRSRIIFPIYFDKSRISGFGGRLYAPDDQAPKYLNSPETAVYHKSRILYALPQALDAIKASSSVYVVEGYMDVIALHQVGVKNVVATCGTALTAEHVQKLGNLANQIFLLFDGDSAGRAAAAKSFKLMVNLNIDIKAVFLPDGLDPDDFAKNHLNNTLRELQRLRSTSLLRSFLRDQLDKQKVATFKDLGANAKAKLAEEALKIINLNSNAVVRNELIKELGFDLSIDPSLFSETTKKLSQPNSQAVNTQSAESSPETLPSAKEIRNFYLYLLQALSLSPHAISHKVLGNAQLVSILPNNYLELVNEIAELSDNNQSKQSLRELVDNFRSEWSGGGILPKDLKTISVGGEDHLANRIYQQCLAMRERYHLQKRIESKQKELNSSNSYEDKAKLSQEILALNKELKQTNFSDRI